jgi:hypothetical protein
MALEACNDAIAAAIGRELSDREKASISRKALELKRKIDAAGGDPLAMESVLGEFGKGIATDIAVKKRNAAINFRVAQTQDAARRSVDFADQAPGEYARGKFVQSQKNYFGAKASLGTAVGREAHQRTSAYTADLIKAGLHDYAFKSGDDKNIWLAREALNDPKADPGALAKQYGKDALAVAQIMEKHQESVRGDRNLAGAWTARSPDFVTAQTHEPYTISRAGGNHYGSEEAFQQWKNKIEPKTNWAKAFDGQYMEAGAKRDQLIRSQWTQFGAAKHLSFQDGPSVGSQNIGKRASHERQWVFNSPEDAFDYWNEFGKHGSLAESVWHDLERGGRDVAIMREWGPNARDNIKSFFDRWQTELSNSGDLKGFDELKKARLKVENQYLPTLTDSIGHPDSNFAAHYLSAIRQTLLMAKIGAALPSMIGDTALKASYAQRYGTKSTTSFIGELGRSMGAVFASPDALDKQTLAAEFGIRLQNSLTPLGMEYHELAGTGKLAKWNQMVMKASGHSWGSNAMRTDTLSAEGFRQHQFASREWEALPVGRRDLMSQFGISKEMWDVMRKAEPLELDGGKKIMAPSQIRAMDPEAFRSIAKGESDGALKRARDLVADNYRNMLGELADTATSEPNRNMRTILNAPIVNAQPWQQELYRGFFVLKGFLANYMRNHLGGLLMGQDANPENVGFTKALWRAVTLRGEGSSYKMMGSLIAGGVGLGYLKDALSDLAAGKTPENPVGDHYGHAMVRAFTFQSLGLLSDFVLGAGSKPDANVWEKMGALSGPEAETMGDIVDNLSKDATHLWKLKNDDNYSNDDFLRDFGKDSASWTGTLYHSIPGNNLLWSKFATDYFVLDNIMDMLNPGYKDRLKQRASEKQGQNFWIGQLAGDK